MHGGGQGATLLCGMRTGWSDAKAAAYQDLAARCAMVSEFLTIFAVFDDQFHRSINRHT